MKKIFFACALALCLPACATTGVPSAPVAVANATVLDEQVAIGVNLAYKAARLAVETGVEAGFIKGQRAVTVAELDNRAYAAIVAVDLAYKAGNASDYVSAGRQAIAAITALVAAAKGGQ